jgi:hypothetical protein
MAAHDAGVKDNSKLSIEIIAPSFQHRMTENTFLHVAPSQLLSTTLPDAYVEVTRKDNAAITGRKKKKRRFALLLADLVNFPCWRKNH